MILIIYLFIYFTMGTKYKGLFKNILIKTQEWAHFKSLLKIAYIGPDPGKKKIKKNQQAEVLFRLTAIGLTPPPASKLQPH